MNLENFHTFLNEPANLHRVSYSELKSLVAAYPYSANLRILLLLKSKLEKNPELAHNLKLAATYSPNRSILYRVMHDRKLMEAIRGEASVREEFLELKDLSEVQSLLERDENVENPEEKTMERTIPVSEVREVTSGNNWSEGIFEDNSDEEINILGPAVISIDSLLSSVNGEESLQEALDKSLPKEEDPIEKEEIKVSNKMLMNFAAENLSGYAKMLETFELTSDEMPLEIIPPRVEEIQKPIIPTPNVKPQPKDSFSSWLTQFESDLNREPEVPDINKNLDILESGRIDRDENELNKENKTPDELTPESTPEGKLKAKDIAKKSLSLNDEIVSETLAKLLVQQERYDKAIDMYRRLMVKFPDREEEFKSEISEIILRDS